VSVEYYKRLERGNASGVSDSVLEALASALRLDNSARFTFLDPVAQEFYLDWERVAKDLVAHLRSQAGRNPYDRGLGGHAAGRRRDRRARSGPTGIPARRVSRTATG
jgi:hypothetical protein